MSILKLLEEKSIVSFELNKECTKVEIREACDWWYRTDLDKEAFGRMLGELNAILEQMK